MSTQPAPGPSRVPLIGQVLSGRYRILAKLGEGAMAAVYLAEHTGVGKTIVLKVLLPDLASQPEFVEGFLREARIAAEIQDDAVIDIFYSGRSPEGYVFLAMEHVDGPTLFALLAEQGPLPWERAKPVLLQIAGALAAAHAQGVVHRDVKPENVLVGRRKGADGEYIKVVDFGIANARGDASATGAESVAGTPEFMSPEQAQGRTPDARDDVYAFGCLMYQVLTGDVPFRDDDMARLLLMHLRDPVQPPRQRRPDLEIPGGAQEIVMRALAKTRADRWQDMAEVQRQLAAVDAPPPPHEAEASAPPGDVVALSPSIEPRFRAPEAEAPKPARPNLRLPKDKPRGKAPLLVGAGVVLAAVGFAVLRYLLLTAPGRIEIVTAPPEAEIYVDGQKMSDRSPMFLDASPGPYNVVVRSPGYETLTTVLVIAPRGNERVPINLIPLPAPLKTDAPPPRHAAASARRKAPAPPSVTGVTFIDFKKAAAEQHAR